MTNSSINNVIEKQAQTFPGWGVVAIIVCLEAAVTYSFYKDSFGTFPGLLIPFWILGFVSLKGFFTSEPNEAKVFTFFGRYVGSEKRAGFFWVNPFTERRTVFLRISTFDSNHIKVNDRDGNPIEIGAVITWNVVNTAKAVFQVGSVHEFVKIQSEAVLRNIATKYSYDTEGKDAFSLRGHATEVAEQLRIELQEKMDLAGVKITDARISHLAYSPEIAQAMLQRQQAGAIISARQMIVDGAVGMVELALERLLKNNTVRLNDDQKASMVANLLVVLCSERGSQPIVNASTPQCK